MKKQKKIIAIMLSLSLIFGSSNNLMSYAVNEDKSNVNDTVSRENSNLEMGPKYKKKKKNLIQPYSIQPLENGVELGKEALDDLEQLKNIEYLEKITDEKYEVALAHENGDYTYLSSAKTIEEAKKIVNSKSNQKNIENNIIPVIIDEDGLVVYAAEGIAKIVKIKDGQSITATIDIYKSATTSSRYTYISHAYIDDAPIIAESGNRVKVQVNGLTGWIDKSDSEGTNVVVVPINQAVNLSYYKKTSNGTLQHYISSDVKKANSGHFRSVGVAPSFMEVEKKYYSYDGIYFYTNINTLISDLKNNTNNNAVNKSNPYYNYYLYLPGRSKTAFYAKEIDKYIENNTPSDSKLRGQGTYLVAAQNKYGVNANLILGVAMNESAKGTSNLAKTKNNLFGIKAFDTNVGAATTFNTVGGCIDTFAKEYMSNQYFNPKAWQYSGSNLGNKAIGANVWYASDPFWGEKAASYIYEMDRYISGSGKLIENNKHQIALYTAENKVKNSSGTVLYEILNTRVSNKSGQVGDPLVILSQSSKGYEIYPDRQYSIASSPPVDGEYTWSIKGYVSTSGIKKINTQNSSARPDSNEKPVINASDKELKVGDSFNDKTGVTATDKEDGNLTSKIIVKTNTVNTKVVGTYKVVYEVTDADFNKTTKEITVKVGNEKPVITASNKELNVGDTFNPMSGVSATDREDGNLTSKIKVKENTVNTKVLGTYKVVYEVTDSYGNVVTKEIKVTVGKVFASFTVNNISNKSTTVTGNGVSGATVKAYVGSKQIGSTATVNSSGKYSITIPVQAAKTKVTVKMSKTGYATAEKSVTVIGVASSNKKTLTKDIYKYDAGSGKYLTYINNKGYSQYSYLNTSGNYAFTPSSWMTAAGLDISMPKSSNGYTMTIDNNYIQMYNAANSLLNKVKNGQISKSSIEKELRVIEEMNDDSTVVEGNTDMIAKASEKAAPKKTLTKDIYRYDAGSGKYLTYINGKGYSQYSYLNTSGNYAFTPSSWMKAAGLEFTMPSSGNGYTMKITNPYINKYKDVVKQIEAYI